jgi:hypothetical protein
MFAFTDLSNNTMLHSYAHAFSISLKCNKSLDRLASKLHLNLPWMHLCITIIPCPCRGILVLVMLSTTP